MASLKEFTIAEVKTHNTDKDLYVIIHDKVYDLTKFQNEHPGGAEVLVEVAGKESTQDFEDVGHSKDAVELMAKYLVGTIIEAERKTKKKDNTKCFIIGGSALAIALGAIILYKCLKK